MVIDRRPMHARQPQLKYIYDQEGFIIGNLFAKFILWVQRMEFLLIYLDPICNEAGEHAAN
jgi:hypothetical protein